MQNVTLYCGNRSKFKQQTGNCYVTMQQIRREEQHTDEDRDDPTDHSNQQLLRFIIIIFI